MLVVDLYWVELIVEGILDEVKASLEDGASDEEDDDE